MAGVGLRLGNVDDGLSAEVFSRDGHLVFDELDGLLAGPAVPRDNRRRVNLLPNKLVRELEQLGCHDHNRGGAVADLVRW